MAVSETETQVERIGKTPSNRRDLPPLNGGRSSCELGIDRLSVSFDAGDYDPNPENWDRYSVGGKRKPHREWFTYEDLHPRDGTFIGTAVERYSKSVEVGDGVTAFVGVSVFAVDEVQRALKGKVEFNPSRIVDPAGHRLATIHESTAALEVVVNRVGFLIAPMLPESLETFKVKRIDVARDFHGVMSPSELLRGLAGIPRKYAKKSSLYNDPVRGGAQTLMVGSGAGVVRLYDKWAETKGRVEAGTIRWEVQAREAWCKRLGGLSSVAQLNFETVERLAVDRWEWSAMGAEILSHLSVRELARRLGVRESEASAFWGWVVDHSLSSGWTPSPTTEAKYRRYLRELGIGFKFDAFVSSASSVRLDWATGTQVVQSGEEVDRAK